MEESKGKATIPSVFIVLCLSTLGLFAFQRPLRAQTWDQTKGRPIHKYEYRGDRNAFIGGTLEIEPTNNGKINFWMMGLTPDEKCDLNGEAVADPKNSRDYVYVNQEGCEPHLEMSRNNESVGLQRCWATTSLSNECRA